jgi:hypothetical protein
MAHLAHDLAALNKELGSNDRTAAVYEECRGDRPELLRVRRMMSNEVFDVLLKQRRYEHVLKAMNDLIEETPRDIGTYVDAKAGRMGQKLPPMAIDAMRSNLLRDVARSYEALLGGREIERAYRLADQAIAAENIGETYVTLIEAALRAEQASVARSLVDRARKSLSETEFDKVQGAAKALPPIG